jgi:hypothetical protein
LLHVVHDRVRGRLVALGLDQVQQLAGPREARGQVADAVDGLVKQRTLATQGLRTLGIVPDLGIAELALDLLQAFALGVVVKETPSAHPADRPGRRCAGGRD